MRVGVMGLGVMGMRAAAMLRALGFPVSGWSRGRKSVPGMACHAGAAELGGFLAGTDLLVSLLPATEATRGILAAPLLAQLPRGAMLVNAGRGMHQRIADILAALDSGQLAAAVLDVFETEPLPPEHPAWTHPRLTVTPHLASTPSRAERARFVAAQIAAIGRGEAPAPLWNPETGY
jgi:glyoxylate/hydroxypyruvate reductase A